MCSNTIYHSTAMFLQQIEKAVLLLFPAMLYIYIMCKTGKNDCIILG